MSMSMKRNTQLNGHPTALPLETGTSHEQGNDSLVGIARFSMTNTQRQQRNPDEADHCALSHLASCSVLSWDRLHLDNGGCPHCWCRSERTGNIGNGSVVSALCHVVFPS